MAVTILLSAIWGIVGLEPLVAGCVSTGFQTDSAPSSTLASVITRVFGVTLTVGVSPTGGRSDVRGRRPLIAGLVIGG